jgi:hypothetical protein
MINKEMRSMRIYIVNSSSNYVKVAQYIFKSPNPKGKSNYHTIVTATGFWHTMKTALCIRERGLIGV